MATETRISLSSHTFVQRKGMNAETGATLSGVDHLWQSLKNIIETPTGQRVMRGAYGSVLHEKLDAPATPSNLLTIYALLSDALEAWEPRFKLKKISSASETDEDGKIIIKFFFEGIFLGEYISSGAIVL